MKLKRRYVVVIVAVMLVLTAVVASLIVSSVQGSRIAYVAVSADKEQYAMNETVTFQLRPLTEGVEFTIGGADYDNYGYRYEMYINIIRISDDIDPYSLIDDPDAFSSMWTWTGQSRVGVPIPEFTSSGEALDMAWNGTLQVYDRTSGSDEWLQATAGYYLLYPGGNYYSSYGSDRTVKFFLDHSSVFYYDSLDVDYDLKTRGQETTLTINLTLPAGASSTQGTLTAYVPNYNYDPTGESSSPYLSFPVQLDPGVATTVTIKVPGMSYEVYLDATLATDDVTYAFGFSQGTIWDGSGGETHVIRQY